MNRLPSGVQDDQKLKLMAVLAHRTTNRSALAGRWPGIPLKQSRLTWSQRRVGNGAVSFHRTERPNRLKSAECVKRNFEPPPLCLALVKFSS